MVLLRLSTKRVYTSRSTRYKLHCCFNKLIHNFINLWPLKSLEILLHPILHLFIPTVLCTMISLYSKASILLGASAKKMVSDARGRRKCRRTRRLLDSETAGRDVLPHKHNKHAFETPMRVSSPHFSSLLISLRLLIPAFLYEHVLQ